MTEGYDLLEVLNNLEPSSCSYQEWVNVGMALKEEGYHASDCEAWSSRDTGRYHQGGMLPQMEQLQRGVLPGHRRHHRTAG